MSSRDPLAPARVEELLGGAVPEGEREAIVQGLVRELRSGPGPAPAAVRARVCALTAEPPGRRLPRPRLALAVAFALLAVAALGAALAQRGDGERAAQVPLGADEVRLAPLDESTSGGVDQSVEPASGDTPTYDTYFAAESEAEAQANASRSTLASGLPPRIAGRATDVDLLVELRLAGADELSAAAVDAMGIARDLGGHVAASNVDTKGEKGEAKLELRVPVGRVEDALVRLSALGTVTAQNVVTEDLQTGIDLRETRIEAAERAIRADELRLASGTLTPERRLRIQLRLERTRAHLADLRRQNAAERREAATAELTLLLHTRPAPAAAEKDDEGGVAGTARDALELLAAAAAVGLFLAIVLSPVLLLAFLLWLALRSRTRRIEARLLDRTQPAAPPASPPA